MIARERPGRYYIGWRGRALLVSRGQLRLATTGEATAAEVIAKEAGEHAQERIHEACFDLTGVSRKPKLVRKGMLKIKSRVPGRVLPQRLQSFKRPERHAAIRGPDQQLRLPAPEVPDQKDDWLKPFNDDHGLCCAKLRG